MSEQFEVRARINTLFQSLEAMPHIKFSAPGTRIKEPQTQGVYAIRAGDGTVLHVGRTVSGENGLAQRLQNHLSGKSSFVRAYLKGDTKHLRDTFTFQCIEVENDRERALLEFFAIAWHCPLHVGLGRNEGNDE